MPTFDPRDLLGKIIYAKKDLTGYWGYPGSSYTQKINKGQAIGRLYTVVQLKGDKWTSFVFQQDPFYIFRGTQYTGAASKLNVECTPDSFDTQKLIDQGVPDLKEKAKEEKEEAKKEEEGAVVYYIKEYAGKVLGLAALTYGGVQVAKALINRKSS